MENQQTTPTPWHIKTDNDDSFLVFDPSVPLPLCRVFDDPEVKNGHANARLIAAAPALLDTLESILPYAERDIGEMAELEDEAWPEAYANLERARAAIAQAKGE